MQAKEEVRLDSLCTVDGKGGAHCVRKWGYRPTVSKNEEVSAHCSSREEMELDSLCTVDGFGGTPCVSK